MFGEMDYSVRTEAGELYSILRVLQPIQLGENQLLNEFDCPLLELTHKLAVVPSTAILTVASIVHECTPTCQYIYSNISKRIEMEDIQCKKLVYIHDKQNTLYSLNIYCMQYQP